MHKEGLFLTVFCRLRALSGLLDDVLNINNKLIRPIDVIKALLPNPKDLAENYKGSTFIGVKAKGFKDKVFKEMMAC
jgi:saccharopine dehydrogenase-like NADP-dependent oxidoreductase